MGTSRSGWGLCSKACFFRVIAIIGASQCFLGPDISLGAQITVQDISDAISSRRSKVSDLQMQYVITDKNQDALYAQRSRESKSRTPARGGKDEEAELVIPRSQSNAYNLSVKGNKRAFEIYDILHSEDEKSTRTLKLKATYDGETFKGYSPERKNGTVRRIAPERVIQFPTLPNILGVSGQDLQGVLESKTTEASIRNVTTDKGDVIAELVLRRMHLPDPDKHSELSVIAEFVVDVNMSKDAWPVQIREYQGMVNTETGETTRELMKETTASHFIVKNGVYYPTEVESSAFGYDYELKKGGLIPHTVGARQLLSTQSIVVERLDVNTGLSDDVFKLDFPDGTSVYDGNTDMAMVVGEPIETLVEHMGNSTGLRVSQYTEEEARAIMAQRQQEQGNTAQAASSPSKGTDVTTKHEELPPHSKQGPVPVRVREVEVVRPVTILIAIVCAICVGYLIVRRGTRSASTHEHTDS
jgi:hypothetical protein